MRISNYFLLVAEKEETIQKFEALESDHEILIARSEEDAVELLIDQDNYIDIVFIENIIFNRNGINILKKLKNISFIPEYIMITESRNLEIITACMRTGATDCISKPLNTPTIIHKINLAINSNELDKKVLKDIEKEDIIYSEKQVHDIAYQDALMKKIIVDGLLPIDVSSAYLDILQKDGVRLAQMQQSAILRSIAYDINNLKANILVIDDEPEWQFHLSNFLEEVDHNVFIAENATEGLKIAQEIEGLDVVLLDVKMPDMNGTELLPILLEKSPNCKVIMVTAFDDMEAAIATINDGAFDYVQKPYTNPELLSKINRALKTKSYPILLNRVVDKLKNKTLSFESRLTMFEVLCDEREYAKSQIRMEEVYVFFPEFRNKDTSISSSTTFSPQMLIKNGIRSFIESLSKSHQ
ncbi:hypothetical protein DID80_05605 [Candidatus Marinamargulisbacteria bacterium SCGC AAA071-K20]|nr:hypothetical protein DID80_05605 [Candidatus Marinamargulisbacteria bacterium SCGC AAA071-K20]